MPVPAGRLAALLLLLPCLSGCIPHTPSGPLSDRVDAAFPSSVPTVPTFTAMTSATPTPVPRLTAFGTYDNRAEHTDGRYELQLAGTRVAATLSTSRSSVEYWARTVPRPLFTIPEPFRPPYPVLRTVAGMPVRADGTPDPARSAPHRFLLRVDPDGGVYYVDDDRVEGAGHLAYMLHTVWDTAPPPPAVPTFTPTFTPTATPTFTPTPPSLPTPTPTFIHAVPSPTPSLTWAGAYDNLAEHADGRYALQLAGSRVAATFSTARSPVQYWAREVPHPLFTVPEPFRPPYPVLRTAVGTPVRANGVPDPDHPELRRFLLRVNPDGTVHYVDDDHVEGVGHLAYSLDTVWGTTPAANDRAVLEILDRHWFRKTLLSAEPPPVQFRCLASESVYWGTLPATSVGAFVTFDADGRVTGLGAHSDEHCWSVDTEYHFNGPLLPELGELQRLELLDLGYREYWFKPAGPTRKMKVESILDEGGRMPADTGALTGAIPPQLWQLPRLRYLDLRGQLLTGPLPPDLGRLVFLEHLDLSDNLLTDSMPLEWGQLTHLQTLNLAGNQLTGSLPPELGHLVSLKYLNLGTNLWTPNLVGNRLTTLPPELGQLANLQTLNLEGNWLTTLPPELGQLANLQTLNLEGNRLTTLPSELGQLANLQTLNLEGNRLTTLPSELGQLANLQTLNLEGNRLTMLPPELGQLARLQTLNLDFNRLTALVPEWSQLASLQSLSLWDNQLTGPLPPEWGQLANLRYLYLNGSPYLTRDGNELTGPLPPEWGQLASLEYLSLSANQLTGPLPPEWGQLANLAHLYLGANQLTGPLPPEWGQLVSLESLNVSNNRLSGPLPSAWGQLASLEWGYLDNNELTGPVPLEWSRMTNLESLDVRNNQLTGCYPRIFFPNLSLSTELPDCPSEPMYTDEHVVFRG